MARLTFWCDEETNEASASDSPYFLVYVGNAQQQTSAVRRVRRQSWDDNVDAGEPARTVNVAFPEVVSFDLVLIALLEEDFDPDSGLVGNVQDWMNNLDGLLQPTIVGTSDVINIFKQEFSKAINKFLSNDDLLGIRRFTPPQTRHFWGGGGHYRVRFEV